MNLYVLNYGKSKNKMKPIMIDSLKKCQNYEKARSNVSGFYKIDPAPNDSKIWRQKRSTIGGNSCSTVPVINRHGKDRVNGYIGKNGFNAHT